MQSYEQIFEELGIQIPDEKMSDLRKKMNENYRTKVDYDKVTAKRDEYKASLEDVQVKLDGFKDVDVKELQGKISTLTADLQAEKNARAADARKVELEKTVSSFLGEKKFVNALTKTAIRNSLLEELDKDTAKGKSIEDIFKGLITDSDGKIVENILVDENQEKARQQAARFTTTFKGTGTGGTMTKADFKNLSLDDRMKLKQSDPELYNSLKG